MTKPILRPLASCSKQDRARAASVKVRTLCCQLSAHGYRHEYIAHRIECSPRALAAWKAGTTVPHWAIEALESEVMRAARKVGG